MTKIKAYALLLLFLFVASGSVLAEANNDAAAKTPLRFYQAVNAKDYPLAWSLLTEASKARLATMVAEEAKMPVADVRQLFDTTDASIRDGFWESFRGSSHPEQYPGFTYTYSGQRAGAHIVTVTKPGASETLELQVKDEGGYKFALAETYKI